MIRSAGRPLFVSLKDYGDVLKHHINFFHDHLPKIMTAADSTGPNNSRHTLALHTQNPLDPTLTSNKHGETSLHLARRRGMIQVVS